MQSLKSLRQVQKYLDFIVSSHGINILEGYSPRPIFSPRLPTMSPGCVPNFARKILLDHLGLAKLTTNQERVVDLLVQVAGPVPRQVEYICELFRTFLRRKAPKECDSLMCHKFLPALLEESVKQTMDVCNDFQISAPKGSAPYCLRVQRIIFLRFVLWCCSLTIISILISP